MELFSTFAIYIYILIVPAGTLIKVLYREGKVDDDSIKNTVYLVGMGKYR